MKLTNFAQPIRVTEINDIDAELQKELTLWFEQRVKEVQIDPNSQDNPLKNNSIRSLATVLKTAVQQLDENK